MHPGGIRTAWPVALAIGVTALYLGALRSDFVYDDHEVIRAQPVPASAGDWSRLFAEPHFHGLPYYRPVTRATLLAQKALHGDRPAPFHAANALLAGAAAVLAYALLRAPALALPPALAALAAALFAVHPAASSCVYPIASGRETLLPGVAMLAAVAAWLRGRRALAHATLGLALFAKEQAVVLPALFALADACRLAPRAPPLRPSAAGAWLRRHGLAIALAAFYLLVRQRVLGGRGWQVAVLDDPQGPVLSLLFAVQTAFAPFVGLVYEPEAAVWLSPVRLAGAFAALVALAALARGLRAPPAPTLVFWAGWFVLVQLPTANWLRQEARFDERYAWLALLAIPAVAAGAVAPHWTRDGVRRAAVAVAAGAVLALAAISATRAAPFRDDEAFAAQWLRTDPGAAEAHHLLGMRAAARGDPAAAIPHYRAALARAPESADLRANLAAALAAQGREVEALAELEQALRLDPSHPEAHLNAGILLARQGLADAAIEHWRAAIRADPGRAAAHARLGVALARRGEREEAAAHLREALRLDPGDAGVRRELDQLVAD
jgi:tetratricopeptide (TPR) repeat protein